MKFLFKIMGMFFDKHETPIGISKHDSIKELKKSDNCYCGSNKEYKQCHMNLNQQEKKVAVIISNSKTNSVDFKVISNEDYDIFKRVSINKINVIDTFGSVEISNADRINDKN